MSQPTFSRLDVFKAYAAILEVPTDDIFDDVVAQAIATEAVGEGKRDIVESGAQGVIDRLLRLSNDIENLAEKLEAKLDKKLKVDTVRSPAL